MNVYAKQKQTHRQNNPVVMKEEREGGGANQVIPGQIQTTTYKKQMNNKVLLYSTGNHIQYPVINHNGNEYEKEYIYIYIYTHTHTYIYISQSLCCTSETNTTL